jgi:hypothetical protein
VKSPASCLFFGSTVLYPPIGRLLSSHRHLHVLFVDIFLENCANFLVVFTATFGTISNAVWGEVVRRVHNTYMRIESHPVAVHDAISAKVSTDEVDMDGK